MALQNYENLNEMHMGVLTEICNIGSGNAATAISQMFGLTLNIDVPGVGIIDINEAIQRLGGADVIRAGLLLPIQEDLNGMIMFLFTHEFAGILLKAVMGTELNSFEELDEMGLSMMNEVANIAAGSFVKSIADMVGMRIDISPPASTIDMVGAIMNVPAVYFANISESILLIENSFDCGGVKADANVILMLEIDSLERLLTKLGIEI